MAEYRYLQVDAYEVQKNSPEAKARGWKDYGRVAGVEIDDAAGGHHYQELEADEGKSIARFYPTEPFRLAFIALLNSMAGDGWRVIQYTPLNARDVQLETTHGYLGYSQRWPMGHFLLFRE